MSLKQLSNRVKITAVLVGATCVLTAPALAQGLQGFYFPDASFFSPFASYYESDDNPDLATLLEGYPDFNSRLQTANLLESFKDQEYLTILVPSEKAFAALSPEMKQKLAKPENVKKLLQYHVVVGQIDEQDIQRRSVATALAKNSIEITGVPVGDKIGVKLNEAIASNPTPAVDGVVIPIDRVLIPPEFARESK